jgi:two-component system response regulator YesN
MIVDDEKMIREGLNTLISQYDSEIEICAEAKDGREAYTLFLQNQPDIVICDIKMPHVSGMELVSQIRLINKHVQIIFLSAYAEKQYLKNAFKFHAVDFIEKPMNTEEFIDAIRRAKAEVDAFRKDHHGEAQSSQLENAVSIKKSDMALELVSIPEKYSCSETIRQLNAVGIKTTSFDAYLCGIVRLQESNPQLQIGISRILSECAYFTNRYLSGAIENHVVAVFIFDSRDSEAAHASITEIFTQVLSLDPFINVGIGEDTHNIIEIKQSYFTAYSALKTMFLKGNGKILTYGNMNQRAYEYSPRILQEFKEALESGNNYQAEKIADDLTVLISECDASDISQVKWIYHELCRILVDTMRQKRLLSEENHVNSIYRAEQISALPTIAQIAESMRATIRTIQEADEKSDFKSRMVYSIEKYIADNICTSLMLRDIAAWHYISVPYLCAVFKKETGNTVNAFILDEKIKKAKELLKDRSLKLKDISDMLGYRNANYFARVFKSVEGITPSTYREKYVL